MANEETVLDRVQELTWAMVDDQINADEIRLLENLLLSDDQARDTYIHCVQLHADLISHFAKPEAPTTAGKMPVLGFLGDVTPVADVQSSPQ